jgi:hypothetical protein
VHEDTISALRSLARRAETAAEDWTPQRDEQVTALYVALRSEAWKLTEDNRWTDEVEFGARFPSVREMETIRRLNAQYGVRQRPAMGSPVQQALRDLAGWAIGVRMAGELRL